MFYNTKYAEFLCDLIASNEELKIIEFSTVKEMRAFYCGVSRLIKNGDLPIEVFSRYKHKVYLLRKCK